jgi:hypothetical protein
VWATARDMEKMKMDFLDENHFARFLDAARD